MTEDIEFKTSGPLRIQTPLEIGTGYRISSKNWIYECVSDSTTTVKIIHIYDEKKLSQKGRWYTSKVWSEND